jgi:hypothetical protein
MLNLDGYLNIQGSNNNIQGSDFILKRWGFFSSQKTSKTRNAEIRDDFKTAAQIRGPLLDWAIQMVESAVDEV